VISSKALDVGAGLDYGAKAESFTGYFTITVSYTNFADNSRRSRPVVINGWAGCVTSDKPFHVSADPGHDPDQEFLHRGYGS